MSDEIFSEGRQLVSAKKAASETGYARDYIGQLSRKGLIEAQRVGGLWYVSLESLKAYQANAEAYVPPPLPIQQPQGLDSVVSFDGKDYVSASKASKLSGYNQDYIGQLSRGGKIMSRQIGNRWYVERAGLLEHKSKKDAMLGAVQSESVGLYRAQPAFTATNAPETAYTASQPLLSYTNENDELMPTLLQVDRSHEREESVSTALSEVNTQEIERKIPIRVTRVQSPIMPTYHARKFVAKVPVRRHGNTMIRATKAGIALTFVLVLSYGIVSLKNNSLYASGGAIQSNGIVQAASSIAAYGPIDWVIEKVESFVAPEAVYRRAE